MGSERISRGEETTMIDQSRDRQECTVKKRNIADPATSNLQKQALGMRSARGKSPEANRGSEDERRRKNSVGKWACRRSMANERKTAQQAAETKFVGTRATSSGEWDQTFVPEPHGQLGLLAAQVKAVDYTIVSTFTQLV